MALFECVELQLRHRSYIARGGQAIDATLVPAPKQHIRKEERSELQEGQSPDWCDSNSRQKDTDASFTKKHGKSYFGYKLSMSLDYKHGFIRGVATGTASEYDGHHFDEVLDMSNTGEAVDADKGSDSAQRREMLKALDLRYDIQRKAHKNKPLSACQQKRNQRIAKKRAKVEHVFADILHIADKRQTHLHYGHCRSCCGHAHVGSLLQP